MSIVRSLPFSARFFSASFRLLSASLNSSIFASILPRTFSSMSVAILLSAISSNLFRLSLLLAAGHIVRR